MTASIDRAQRALWILFGVAVLVSIVHYVDNVANYADYPQSDTAPNPSRGLIGASWFIFTAFGIAGVALFRQAQRLTWAAFCLSVYSISGLVGIGHYTVEGATDMPWWRQLHVIADILCGIAILGFVAWTMLSLRPVASTEVDG